MIKPHTDPSVARSNLGCWVGDVALNEDWMVSKYSCNSSVIMYEN